LPLKKVCKKNGKKELHADFLIAFLTHWLMAPAHLILFCMTATVPSIMPEEEDHTPTIVLEEPPKTAHRAAKDRGTVQ
jgi:hypothetical protein